MKDDQINGRKRLLALYLLTLAIVGLMIVMRIDSVPHRGKSFALKPPKKNDFQADFNKPPLVQTELLPQPCAAAHASTQLLLPTGRLLVAFFAGSREGGKDVAIYLTEKEPLTDSWSAPRKIVTAPKLTRDTMALVNKVGNPVLFYDEKMRLHLFVVGALGGWSTSSIYHLVSYDEGISWSRATRLEMTPLLLFSNLVRSEALALDDDLILLPTYHEFLVKYPEVAVVSSTGKVVHKSQIVLPVSAIQPALLGLDENRLLAFCRNTSKLPVSKIVRAESGTGGTTWQSQPSLEINNDDSGLAVLRFADDAWMLVGNPDKERKKMILYLSRDQGASWNPWFDFGTVNEGQTMAYPSIVRLSANQISITYSRDKKEIYRLVLTIPAPDATERDADK